MALGNEGFAKEHSVAFDDCDGLGTKVGSDVLIGLDQPGEINLAIFPKRVIREMQQSTGRSLHLACVRVDPYILIVMLAFVKLEKAGSIPGWSRFFLNWDGLK